MNQALLELQKVSKHFGGLAAVNELDLVVGRGEIRGLIGPNGAGKTTAFNLISGVLAPTSGRIIFDSEDITRLKPDKIARRGLRRSFQSTVLFGELTVLDNVLVGCHLDAKVRLWGTLLRTRATRQREEALRARALAILDMLGLAALRNEAAKNLPHGHQRALGIAVALAGQPKLLMLDEPVSGMNPAETETMVRTIRDLRDRGLTILLVEHDMKAVMGLCDRITVTSFGCKIAEGTPQEIRENPAVIEAYLGRR